MKRALAWAVVALALTQPLAADDWLRFRGAAAGAAANDPRLPERWSQADNVVWTAEIPGLSWSSPVIRGTHVVMTSAVSAGKEPAPEKGLYDPGDSHGVTKSAAPTRWMVYDLDVETGKTQWSRELANIAPAIGRHIKNSYASETPALDADGIYVYFGAIGLAAALDWNGGVRWSRQVPVHETAFDMGTASSPVVHADRVYLLNDNLKDSYLMALDRRTGQEVWRVKREEPLGATWATPYIWENERRTEIVTSASGTVRSYGLDGTLLWTLTGMTSLTVPSPFATGGILYFGSGYPGASPRPVYAIRPGAHGDISLKKDQNSNDYIVWYQPALGTYQTSALVYEGYYYTLLDRGFLLCHDAKTGQQIYGRQRVSAESTGFTASPWAYNGKIFLLSEDGDTYVVQAGPEFKLLGKNPIGEMTLASPAIAGGSLYLRTQSKLYRVQEKGP